MDRPLSAVRAASRAGVRRRRLQTVSIGVVVGLSTATLVFGLGLLAAANSLFDDAFERARGAHATAFFDAAAVTAERVAATADAPGVTAAAGPFRTAVLPEARVTDGMPVGGDELVVVGRADPGGPVDRLAVTAGRWARGPGEIVLPGGPDGPLRLGAVVESPGLPSLTIVGFANSVTGEPGGWVTPDQVAELGPDGLRMRYRFARAANSPQVQESLAAATAGLPMPANESYVTVEQEFEGEFNQLIPFITVFGMLAMAVSVFIIGNVVSGAVIAGYRRIGVLKALGFTPAQVTAVYVVMVATPALIGCAVGLPAGHLLAARVTDGLADGLRLPSAGGAALTLDAVAAACIMVLVVVAAFVPALRAGRLPAVQAIGAGTVSRRGRGRRVQLWLARTRIPVPVGLGMSLPIARPARTALTLAGLCLGVTAVTMGIGLQQTVSKTLTADTEGHTSVSVGIDPRRTGTVDLSAQQVFDLLRNRPGTAHVMSFRPVTARISGLPSELSAETYSGDYGPFLGDNVVRGRWFTGPGEVVPSEAFLRLHDVDVGDTVTLRTATGQAGLRVVGSFAQQDPTRLMLDAASLPGAAGGLDRRPFAVIVTPETDPAEYARALNAAAGSSGLFAEVTRPDLDGGVVFNGLFLVFSLIICAAAAVGVLNSVVLNARERSRDLGVLKAIGMTPRQVVLMMVTSMAVLGIVGAAIGLPLGVLAHHGVVEITGRLIAGGMADSWMHVYTVALLAPPAGAGLAIAVLGAWLPAGWAAATRTSTVLRTE